MISKDALGILSIVFGAAGYGSYIWSTIRGRTHPHLFTWLVWATVTSVIYFAQINKHGGAGSWGTCFSAVGCFFIALFALFRGEKEIKRSDWLSLITALAALPLWYATSDPLWSVILVTVIDGFGFYPTFRKSWMKPHQENLVMYNVDIMKSALSLGALENYAAAAIIYPIFAVSSNMVFVIMALWRRRSLANLSAKGKSPI